MWLFSSLSAPPVRLLLFYRPQDDLRDYNEIIVLSNTFVGLWRGEKKFSGKGGESPADNDNDGERERSRGVE